MSAARPRGPYPLLVLHAEQGSGKSTTQRMLRALLDPNAADLRSEPRDPRDLIIAATNGWILSYDNLSHVPTWLSDALCRLSTGGGFVTRELYSDADEVLFDAQRPAIVNGIEEAVTRGDALDRAVIAELQPTPEKQRRPERAIWAGFERARPHLLGALLSAVSTALRELPETKLEKLPRMADLPSEQPQPNQHSGSRRVLSCAPTRGTVPRRTPSHWMPRRSGRLSSGS